MLFKREELQELEDVEGIEIVLEKKEVTPWYICKERVFKYEGKYYNTTCIYGNYEYEPDMIECPEVFPKEVVTTIYVTEDKL